MSRVEQHFEPSRAIYGQVAREQLRAASSSYHIWPFVMAVTAQPQPEIRRRRSTHVDTSMRVDLERKIGTLFRQKKVYIDAILFHII